MSGHFSRLERWQQLLVGLVTAGAMVLAALIPVLLTRGAGSPTPITPNAAQSTGPVSPVTASPMLPAPHATAGQPTVLYTAKHDLAATFGADLDNPAWAVAPPSGPSIDLYLEPDGTLRPYNGQIGLMRAQGGNDYQACKDFTAFTASAIPVTSLGTRICVRTSEGRVGMLLVRGASGLDAQVVSFAVTVWENP